METVRETVARIVHEADFENDEIGKIIAMAYYIGRESVAKKLCDEHSRRVSKARTKAGRMRYHRMINSVLNAMGGDIIYSPDYSGDMTATFGSDEVSEETINKIKG
jgi:hypothetical protein